MSKRAIMSVTTISLLVFVLGIGTYAWFTTSVEAGNARIHSGILELTYTGESELDFHHHPKGEYNDGGNHIWRPGEHHDEIITIKNTGNLPAAIYGVSAVPGKDNGKEHMSDFLENMKITIRNGEKEIVTGDLLELREDDKNQSPKNFPGNNNIELNPGEVGKFHVTLKMDKNVTNDIQDHIYNFKLKFHATQHDEEAIKEMRGEQVGE